MEKIKRVRSYRILARSLLLHLLLAVAALIIVVPLIWMTMSSFKPGPEIFAYPLDFLPKEATVENYYRLFQIIPFTRNFLNSVIVTVIYTGLALLFSSLGGFAFAKYEFPLRIPLFTVVLGSMMIPVHALLVPLFFLMKKIGWLDTFEALIIPFAASPLGIFFMRQYILSLPSELIDAARIDGCSELKIYYKIILPLSRPALGALAILLGLQSWNEFLWPLVILRSEGKLTLPIALANLVNIFQEKPEFGVIFAGCFLSILPILILFLLMQRQFISGILMGSLKG